MTSDTTDAARAATIEPRWVNVGATAPTSRSWGRSDTSTTVRDEPDYDWLKVAPHNEAATDPTPDAVTEAGRADVAPAYADTPTARVRSGWGGRRARG